MYVKNGYLVYETSAYNHRAGSLSSFMPLTPGKSILTVEVTPVPEETSGGFRQSFPMKVRMIINNKVDGEITLHSAADNGTLDIGEDLISPVSDNYDYPYTFTGKVAAVKIDVLSQ